MLFLYLNLAAIFSRNHPKTLLLFSFPTSCQTHCNFVSFRQIICFFRNFSLLIKVAKPAEVFFLFFEMCKLSPACNKIDGKTTEKVSKKLKVLIFAATDRFKNRWGETKSSMMDDQ